MSVGFLQFQNTSCAFDDMPKDFNLTVHQSTIWLLHFMSINSIFSKVMKRIFFIGAKSCRSTQPSIPPV